MVSCALCARCNATVLFVIAFIVIVAQVDVDVEEKDAGGLPATLCDWDNLQSYE